MIDPDDLAAFRQAVTDTAPLTPPNRVEHQPPRPLPKPRSPVAAANAEKPKRAKDSLPAHWQHEDPAIVRKRAFDPELAAFHAAMAGVERLPERNLFEHSRQGPSPQARQHRADEQAALHESLFGLIALQDRLEGGDEPFYLRQGVAQNVLRDLRRGRWIIQAEIDLHGLNRDQAREQLAAFLAHNLHEGKRCVRVIHGKGHGSPQKLSILRQLVRGWLMQRREILAYCQARPHDGGEGALMVLLQAARN